MSETRGESVGPHPSFVRFREAINLERAARKNLASASNEFGEYLNGLSGKHVILSGIISSVIAKVTGEEGRVSYNHVATKSIRDTSPDTPIEPSEVVVDRIGSGDFDRGMLIVHYPERETMQWVIDPRTIVSIVPVEDHQTALVE